MRAAALLLVLACSTASAQTFVKITDPANPVVTDVGPQIGFPGAAWIDIDGNGLPDLWSTSTGLYRNLGGGVFDTNGNNVTTCPGRPSPRPGLWCGAGARTGRR